MPNYRNAVKPRRRGSNAWICRIGSAKGKRKYSRKKAATKNKQEKSFFEILLGL